MPGDRCEKGGEGTRVAAPEVAPMYFEAVRNEACMSYLVGCERSCAAIVIDPALDQRDRYRALAAAKGMRIQYLLDTHTHADHFSATRHLGDELGVPVVMHRTSPAPFVDVRVEDGESIIVGDLRLRVMHTPGHTRDSLCVVLPDRVITGDTLLYGATGRTDLPTGDPEALHDSLFSHLLALDPALLLFPAHNYQGIAPRSLGEERTINPRLQKTERGAFVEMMRGLNLKMPDHLTEALRTNCTGGKTASEIIREAAAKISFMTMDELRRRLDGGTPGIAILDVREADQYAAAHVPGAIHLPRGQLEIRIDDVFPDPTVRILAYCEFGKISTIAAATMRTMGFSAAVALDGGFRAWREAGHPVEAGTPRRA
jgi:glyoxylase-like metal-dependent hydrolase (beta-lactamase superfamily II)/rhodanese-related sulfurtransferase